MHIDDKLISRLELLTRLRLRGSERERLRADLEKMLSMVDKLSELDLSEVMPLTHITDVWNNWRADEVCGQLSREEALRNAPDTDGIFFRVPKVIQSKSKST